MCSDGGVSLNSFVATTLSGTRPVSTARVVSLMWFISM